jgi:hypothetical protein
MHVKRTYSQVFCESFFFPVLYSGKADPQCQATPIEFGSPHKNICLQEEPDEHGQGKWEGKQEGKSDKRITESSIGSPHEAICTEFIDICL